MPAVKQVSPRRARTPVDIASQRLRSHRLTGPSFSAADDVVRWLGAVQAQDYHGAKWALALRARDLTSANIDRAFDEGAILRTHVMRPTWHFVAPQDLRWLLTLTSPRVQVMNGHAYRTVELDDKVFRRAHRLIGRALSGRRAHTRSEIAAVLDKGGIPAAGLRLACIVMHAELEALICSGPLRGKQHTYMLVEERVPPAPAIARDEALATLAQRYFTSHGPATARDFSWWSGLTMVDARRAPEMSGSALKSIEIEGQRYWAAAGAAPVGRLSSTVHLLPNYDEHVVAYRDHGHTLDAGARLARDRTDGALGAHLIARDGRVVGGWQRSIEKTRATVATRLLTTFRPRDHRALAAAAEGYGRFLELPVTLNAI
jgi:hypothetical protein